MNVVTNNNIKCTIALAALENVIDPEIGLNIVDLLHHDAIFLTKDAVTQIEEVFG